MVDKYFFSISKLSHFDYCPKRSKLEIFNQVGPITSQGRQGAIQTGNRLHVQYSYANRSFDRLRVRAMIQNYFGDTLQREVDNIVVRGRYDDLRVVQDKQGKKWTVIIELKTTSKKYMWSPEIKAAVRQLKLYMWILQPYLETHGFPLWKRSYVEIYSQRDGSLMKIVPVEYEDQTEWIRNVVLSFQGLERVSMPSIKFCKFCPQNVRSCCDWHMLLKEDVESI